MQAPAEWPGLAATFPLLESWILQAGTLPIPSFQPLPLPAPVWLLNILLILGFVSHAIPMNVALAGGLTAMTFILIGHFRKHPYAGRFGRALAFSLPFFISVAITQGVVPLLFLQLTYGPLFYTSSILMGAPWMGLIGLLLIAYYSHYAFTYRQHRLGNKAAVLLALAGVLFLGIAFLFTNNTTLMLTPEKWVSLYTRSPAGVNLNLSEPTLWPRYLHFVLASVAVTGLTMGCFGLYWIRREVDYGQWLLRTGAAIYLVVTALLQTPVGLTFLLLLPEPVRANLLGGDAAGTGWFMGSMLLDIISLVAMALAWARGNAAAFRLGLASALTLVLSMSVVRHLVRVYYTQPFFQPERVPVQTQWDLLSLFLLSVVVGAAYLAWLIWITWRAFHPPVGGDVGQTPSYRNPIPT